MQTSSSHARKSALLLVVDGDDTLRDWLMKGLCARGFDVQGAANIEQAVDCAVRRPPTHALVELSLPGTSGLELLQELRGVSRDMRIVIFTGYGSIASAVQALHAGAWNYLTKPATLDEIVAAFEPQRGAEQRPRVAHDVPSLSRVEWEHIQRVLHGCDGNISHAARLLGVHRRSLQRKLQKQPTAR